MFHGSFLKKSFNIRSSMRKKFLFIITLIILISSSFKEPNLPEQKKLLKVLNKVFDPTQPVKVINSPGKSCLGNELYVVSGNDTLGTVYTSRVFSCRAGGCSLTNNEPGKNEGAEYFDYYCILDRDGKIILVSIFNYQSSHGQQVRSKGWLKQFKDYGGNTGLTYGKNIQAISGATISARSLTEDIQEKMNCRKHYSKSN